MLIAEGAYKWSSMTEGGIYIVDGDSAGNGASGCTPPTILTFNIIIYKNRFFPLLWHQFDSDDHYDIKVRDCFGMPDGRFSKTSHSQIRWMRDKHPEMHPDTFINNSDSHLYS